MKFAIWNLMALLDNHHLKGEIDASKSSFQ